MAPNPVLYFAFFSIPINNNIPGGVCAGGGGQEPDLRPHPAPREELPGVDAGEHFLVHIFLHIFYMFFLQLIFLLCR